MLKNAISTFARHLIITMSMEKDKSALSLDKRKRDLQAFNDLLEIKCCLYFRNKRLSYKTEETPIEGCGKSHGTSHLHFERKMYSSHAT
jgi:hypothetical protein